MARTIEVIAPAGIQVMNLDLFDATTDAPVGAIALTERTNT